MQLKQEYVMQESFFVAIGILVASFIIKIAYEFGYVSLPSYDSKDPIRPEKEMKEVLIRMVKGVLVILLIAGVLGVMSANSSSSCSDSDPVYGGGSDCEVIEGTGGTIDMARATFVFTILAAPFVYGCYKKIKDIRYGKVNQDYKNTILLRSEHERKINALVDEHMKRFYKQESQAKRKKGNK